MFGCVILSTEGIMTKKAMYSIISFIAMLLLIAGLAIIIINTSDKKEEKIEVNTNVVQKYYSVGEPFNENSVELFYINKDGQMSKVHDFVVDFNEYNMQETGEYTIKVNYKDLTTQFNVSVVDNASIEEFVYNGMIEGTENVLFKSNGKILYFSADEMYMYFKVNGEEVQGHFKNNNFKLYDVVSQTYRANVGISVDEMLKYIADGAVYDANLNLAQNYMKLNYQTIVKNLSTLSFVNGQYTIENASRKADYTFDNDYVLKYMSTDNVNLNYQKNTAFEVPKLPAEDNPEEQEENLLLNSTNVQKYFLVGNDFNSEGLVVEYQVGNQMAIVLADGDYEVDYSAYKSSEVGLYPIIVKYKDLQAIYSVNVISLDQLQELMLQDLAFINNFKQQSSMTFSYFSNEALYYNYPDTEFWYVDGYAYTLPKGSQDRQKEELSIEEVFEKLSSAPFDSNLTLAQAFYKSNIIAIINEIKTVENPLTLTMEDGNYKLKFRLDSQEVDIEYVFAKNFIVESENVTMEGEKHESKIEYNIDFNTPSLPDIVWQEVA